MKFSKKLILGCAFLSATVMQINAQDFSASIEINGTTKNYASVEAKANGDIVAAEKIGGIAGTFKQNSYIVKKINLSKNFYRALDAAIKGKKYDEQIKIGKNLFDRLKYLGEGTKAGLAWAEALLETKKYDDAIKTFTEVLKYCKKSKDQLEAELGLGKALLAVGNKYSDLVKRFPHLLSKGGEAAAFVFNAQGAYAKANNNDKEALLCYMRTFKMFPKDNKDVASYRAEAKKQIISLFEKMGDNRAKTFAIEK